MIIEVHPSVTRWHWRVKANHGDVDMYNLRSCDNDHVALVYFFHLPLLNHTHNFPKEVKYITTDNNATDTIDENFALEVGDKLVKSRCSGDS